MRSARALIGFRSLQEENKTGERLRRGMFVFGLGELSVNIEGQGMLDFSKRILNMLFVLFIIYGWECAF